MYVFRREDNGELIEVDFETMMGQKGGFITLPDGVSAKRCTHLEHTEQRTAKPANTTRPDIVSDTLGVTYHQVEAMRQDASRHGFTGVSFTPDPAVPQFYQCRIGSVKEWRRYVKHRGYCDLNRTNGSGATITAEQLSRAQARLLEQATINLR